MAETVRIAGVQMDISFADKERNLQRMTQFLEQTAAEKAHLTVFPECALTGYCFDSLEEALPYAEAADGASTASLQSVCARLGVYAVFGMLEADGDRLFNACLLVGPEGLIGSYRKVHLPYLGVDRFTTPGDRPFAVHDAGGLRVGMNICYDGSFPEAARILALEGADLIVLPTNWPPGSDCTADFVINARAMENSVYYMSVDRVGVERGFAFIGKSRICDPGGHTIADAPHANEQILYADVDPARARRKHIVRVPDKHEIDRFADRRPEMYGPLTAPIESPVDRRK